MSSFHSDRRRFNTMLASLGLMLPGSSLFAAPTDQAGASPMDPRVHPELLHLTKNDWVPNNAHLPVLVYRNVIKPYGDDPADQFEARFVKTGWPPQWRAGVYSFHHYHSTAHEVLGFVTGHASLMLGGPNGQQVEVHAGDVAVLPTGTGHCNLGSSDDFLVVGAYPPDQHWDICRGPASSVAMQRMEHLAFPESDPVTGSNGALRELWTPA